MANEHEDTARREREFLRGLLRGVGLEADDETLAKLAPQVPAVIEHGSCGVEAHDLADIEPVVAFDPRWKG